MMHSNICKKCNQINNSLWILKKTEEGSTIKVCKACSDKWNEGAIDTTLAEKRKEVQEKAREEKNAAIVRQLKATKPKRP